MDFIPYNSSLTYHKSPFGAVCVGTTVNFRIVLRKDFGCSEAYLQVHTEGTDVCNVRMTWECSEGEYEEWWSCTFIPEKPDLYFYKFRIVCNGETRLITKSDWSTGRIANTGEEFFFTVYSESFKTPDSLKGSVIYQIFPDRFCFSGNPKHNIPENRIIRNDWGGKPNWNPDKDGQISEYDFFMGDFKGIESKLGYLSSLGVGYIYLNPIFSAESNHRYDTADYERPDVLLGTESDFADLCSKASGYGIKIILDGVFSHTGSESKYFNKSGKYDEIGAYNSKSSKYFDWYRFTRWPDKYDCWWGVDILPEIDEENDDYISYVGTILQKWQKLGASGWRLDVADELPDKFLDFLRRKVKQIDPDSVIIGEVWEDASNKISYGNRRKYLLGNQLDSVMNYPFAEAMIHFAVTGEAEDFNNNILAICENYPKCVLDCLMNHIGTHDTCRILSRLGTLDGFVSDHLNRYDGTMTEDEIRLGKKLLKMISCIQYTLPGVPSIYYGDEAGLGGGVDPFNRMCFPWGREDEEITEHYRLLGNIRKHHQALKDGCFEPVSSTLGCVAFKRKCAGETIMTIANRNSHSIEYILPEEGYVSLTGQKVTGNRLYLDSNSASILVLE